MKRAEMRGRAGSGEGTLPWRSYAGVGNRASISRPPAGVDGALALSRRRLLVAGAALATGGCHHQEETPLAHLYGPAWVSGAYELYANRYRDVQVQSEDRSREAYRVLARRGVTALEALQAREVPFAIRADGSGARFTVERKVPERLTFTAEMRQADRDAATASWQKAREHIQTDYEEVRRLDAALTTLLAQLERLRGGAQSARHEQFRVIRRLESAASGELPYQLPYAVSRTDYEGLHYLLIERLDDDRARLDASATSVAAVGLTARATDTGSGSLAVNLHKVLVAVVTDAEGSRPRAASYPGQERDKLLAAGRARYAELRASPAYAQWKAEQQAREDEALGAPLALLDRVSGLPVSALYRTVMAAWRGDHDYLGYLKEIAALVPAGRSLASALGSAVDTTERVRTAGGALAELATSAPGDGSRAVAGGLVNTASHYALSRLPRQLSFYASRDEADAASAALARSGLEAPAAGGRE